MIGETLDGKYEIVRKVGSGGMGAVYEARHNGTGRRVAVKVITGELAKNQTLLTRFHREAMASGAIETQHIVQVLDTGTDPRSDLPFIVMEYLNGEDLAAVIQRLPILPPELALRITAQVCIGLQKAHDANVVHRDIKPGNLFLSKRDDGELILKLLDFGIAKIKLDRVQHLESSGLTRTGHVLGSPLYMSPEQARGHKNIDHRTDIWSLGTVLYQMLAGCRPHEDIDALGELIIAICSEPPRPIQDHAPWVPPEIAAIVHGALFFDPAQRYQSASQMLEAIKPLLPGGWALTEDMLATLPEQERQVVAPRFEVVAQSGAQAIYRPSDAAASGGGLEPTALFTPVGVPAPSPSMPTDVGLRSSYAPAAPPAGRPGMASSAFGADAGTADLAGRASPSEAAIATGQAQPPTSRVAVRAAVALLASAAIGYALLRIVVPSPAPQNGVAPAPAASPPAAMVAVSPPTSIPAAAFVPAPAPPRTVKLVLVNADVAVEVNGQRVVPNDGIIDITGPLDSVHKVRLTRGKREMTGEVTVTESGASPPLLNLDAKAAPSAGTKAPPAVSRQPR